MEKESCFDTVIERRGSNSVKYDFAKEFGKPEDVLPLWVADMDFKTAPAIIQRMHEIVDHGIFGYSNCKEEYFQAVAGWYKKRFGWEAKKEWLVKTPGVVFALSMAIRAFTKENDSVLIQQPVYYPFERMILHNKRNLVNSPLKLIEGHYEMDFLDFEEKIVNHKVKLFILCSPHNPVGRVWKEWELKTIGDICRKHNVLVVSDEIHSDFTYEGQQHYIFPSISKEYEDMTILCTAPSKTFNLAGLQISNIFIPNPVLRKAFEREIEATGYDEPTLMGAAACQAAYEYGAEWLAELKEYLAENLAFLREYLKKYLPKIHLIEPEGTYLVWLDFRELGFTDLEREDFVVNKAKLWLDAGEMFGAEGAGFERVNIACPRATLKQALDQLRVAVYGE